MIELTSNFKVTCLGEQEIDVYDIEVYDNHNFFGNDILVHNSNYLNLGDIVEKRFKSKCVTDKQIGEFLDRFSDDIMQPEIDATFEKCSQMLNSYKNYMSMKREKICKKMLVVAKKKYAFLLVDDEGHKYYDDPKIKVTGIEVVKSSTPKVVREWLKECLNIIFNKTNEELIDFLDDKRVEFYALPFEEISFPRGVTNSAKEYIPTTVTIDEDADVNIQFGKGTPIGTKAAMGYNQILKKLDIHNKYPQIMDGDKMRFCYIKPNAFKLEILAVPVFLPPELKEYIVPDYRTQFNKAFKKPLENLLKPIGWKTEHSFSFLDV